MYLFCIFSNITFRGLRCVVMCSLSFVSRWFHFRCFCLHPSRFASSMSYHASCIVYRSTSNRPGVIDKFKLRVCCRGRALCAIGPLIVLIVIAQLTTRRIACPLFLLLGPVILSWCPHVPRQARPLPAFRPQSSFRGAPTLSASCGPLPAFRPQSSAVGPTHEFPLLLRLGACHPNVEPPRFSPAAPLC